MSVRGARPGVLLLALGIAAGLAPALAGDGVPAYVGAAKCRICHLPQYNVWTETRHSKALETLGEDRNNPQCLPCHSTGLQGPRDPAAADLAGVQCEACHGPGSLYKSPVIMSKTRYQRDPGQSRQKALTAGLIIPDERVCTSCHNDKSPTFKGFDFSAYREKIVHWD